MSNRAQGICVVHSKTLRLAEEIGDGVVERNMRRKFTVVPDMDEVPGADSYAECSVSGSRLAIAKQGSGRISGYMI